MSDQPPKKSIVYVDEKRQAIRVGDDKRRGARLETETEVWLRADGVSQSAQLMDFSSGGARVKLKAKLVVGQQVTLAVDDSHAPFADAEIVRVIKTDTEYGLRWIRLDESLLPRGFVARRRV